MSNAPVPALDPVTRAIPELLTRFTDERIAHLERMDTALVPVGREIAGMVLSGGKRLRPAFVYWGHQAAAGESAGPADAGRALVPGAAIELLHTFALIHDDIMDRSPQRHGRPAIHVELRRTHADEQLVSEPEWFGISGAILAGDLASVWADALFDTTRFDGGVEAAVRAVYTDLRVEVMAGQYLDLRLAGMADADERYAARVALLKSGRYSCTRPLLLGAALGGGSPELAEGLAAYGDAAGLAFQLRDDVLGLFGDPDETGKGVLEDLREGKRTLLILRARSLATGAARAELDRMLGNAAVADADAERAKQIVTDTGALGEIEQLLEEKRAAAHAAISAVAGPARSALEELADYAVARTR